MRLFLHQLRGEQRLYWRSRELAFFTFLFPLLLFVLLGSVYGNDVIKTEHGVKGVRVPARGDPRLRRRLDRVRGAHDHARHPSRGRDPQTAPRDAFAAGDLPRRRARLDGDRLRARGATLIVLAAAVRRALSARVVSLVLALLLGTLSFAALGLALTGFIRSGEGSSAVVNAIYLPMAFLSGSFWSPHTTRASSR